MIEAIKRLPVTPTQKLVLFCLADCHNGETNRCDPSVTTIMQITGLSNRAVATALAALETQKHITATRERGARSVYLMHPSSEASSPLTVIAVNEVHDLDSSERGSPVNEVHATSEPAAGVVVNLLPKGVNEVHANRKEPELKPEGTGKPEGAGEPPPVVFKAKASKPDWRDWNRGIAEKANAVELPPDASEDFRTAWKRWCDYRTAKAVDARISSEAIEWTVTAAESGIRDCQRAAKTFGWPEVLGRMDQAQAGGWRGFNFDRMTPPRQNGFGQRQPKHPAYDAKTATAGMSADDILKF